MMSPVLAGEQYLKGCIMQPNAKAMETISPPPAPQQYGGVTLLFVFDVGQSYRIPHGFRWSSDGKLDAPGPKWNIYPDFDKKIDPVLRDSIALDWEPTDVRLRPARESIPWCDLTSVHFVFFPEGIAVLRVQGKLLRDPVSCREAFDKWENECPDNNTQPPAYLIFHEVVATAADEYRKLAERAKLQSHFEKRKKHDRFYWIYPLFFTNDASLYPPDKILGEAVDFKTAEIRITWRGAQIAATEAEQKQIEAAFVAASICWQTLHTLNNFLGLYVPKLIFEEQTADASHTKKQTEEIRKVQLFSIHLLNASRLFRWSIDGDVLYLFQALEQVWEYKRLRESIESQTEMASLATTYYETLESKRSEKREKTLKAWGTLLGVLTLISAVSNLINLAEKDIEAPTLYSWLNFFNCLLPTAVIGGFMYFVGRCWQEGIYKYVALILSPVLLVPIYLLYICGLTPPLWPRLGFAVFCASVFLLIILLILMGRANKRSTG